MKPTTLVRQDDGAYLGRQLDKLRGTSPLGESHFPKAECSLGVTLQFAENPQGTGVIWEIDLPDGYVVTRRRAREMTITGTDTDGRDLWVTLIWRANEFQLRDVSVGPDPEASLSRGGMPVARQLARTGIVLPRAMHGH